MRQDNYITQNSSAHHDGVAQNYATVNVTQYSAGGELAKALMNLILLIVTAPVWIPYLMVELAKEE